MAFLFLLSFFGMTIMTVHFVQAHNYPKAVGCFMLGLMTLGASLAKAIITELKEPR